MADYTPDSDHLPEDARPETIAIHGGQRPEKVTGAVTPPIFQTSTYAQPAPGEHTGFEYSRSQNPTRFALERSIAALEGGSHGLAFASGCAATTAVIQLLDEGDHVVASDDLYGGTLRLFDKVMARRGQRFTFVDVSDAAKVESAIQPNTKMVWIETPTNPMLKLADIEAIGNACRARGVLLAVDNTFCSPILQRPLELGADIVVHSTTKYVGGHADVVGGAVVLKDAELAERLWFIQNSCGAVPGPQDCFLTLRGLKTLALRMERHTENALKVARFLEGHDKVRRVIYPGLESHPQYALARKQMKGAGGMISMVIDGDLEAARRFLTAVRLFTLAESLGGVESLIEHPAIMTHASVPPEQREALGIHDGVRAAQRRGGARRRSDRGSEAGARGHLMLASTMLCAALALAEPTSGLHAAHHDAFDHEGMMPHHFRNLVGFKLIGLAAIPSREPEATHAQWGVGAIYERSLIPEWLELEYSLNLLVAPDGPHIPDRRRAQEAVPCEPHRRPLHRPRTVPDDRSRQREVRRARRHRHRRRLPVGPRAHGHHARAGLRRGLRAGRHRPRSRGHRRRRPAVLTNKAGNSVPALPFDVLKRLRLRREPRRCT